MEKSNNQLLEPYEQRMRNEPSDPRRRVGEEVPRIITKKWLRIHYSIGKTNVDRLYRAVLTDDVLQQLGLTRADVRQTGFTYFTAAQSQALAKILFG